MSLKGDFSVFGLNLCALLRSVGNDETATTFSSFPEPHVPESGVAFCKSRAWLLRATPFMPVFLGEVDRGNDGTLCILPVDRVWEGVLGRPPLSVTSAFRRGEGLLGEEKSPFISSMPCSSRGP